MGKVRFGLSNAHYAVWDDKTSAYKTPVPIPGSVQLSLDAQGNSSTFYADNIAYEQFSTNSGYTGTFNVAVAEDQLLVDLLGYARTAAGTVVEVSDAKPASFALLYEVKGNEADVRFALYNCKLSRPSTENNTTTEDTTPDTVTLNVTAIGRDLGGKNVVKGHVESSEASKAAYDSWYTEVSTPDFRPAVVPVASISVDKATASVEAGKGVALKVTVTPPNATDQKVSAASSDEGKATVSVSDKTVTVHGVAATDAGKPVTVTVTCGGRSATCGVTVTPKA